MATRFKSLKLKNSDFFGIALSGSVGRSDYKNLKDLADRTLAQGKVNVVFDLTDVTSIGGGGVKLLATFQEDLLKADGELVFVGASEVMREYLERSFEDLPQQHFATVDELNQINGGSDEPSEPADATRDTSEDNESVAEDSQEMENSGNGLDGVLGKFKGTPGKRRHFVSLNEAVESLNFMTRENDQHLLAQALSDLLYGHDLAQGVELLIRDDDCMLNTSGMISIPCDGGLVPQVIAAGRPLTIIDLDNDILLDEEISVLAEYGPDILLPIVYQGELFALLFLLNDGQERDYSVAETLALELLMQVIFESVAKQKASAEPRQMPASNQSEPVVNGCDTEDHNENTIVSEQPQANNSNGDLEGTLLRLAEELPKAENADHFWTLFAKHTAPSLGVSRLAFIGPDSDKAEVYVGQGKLGKGAAIDEDRFQVYLRSLERPVEAVNLPGSFAETGKELKKAGIQWIVSLNWNDEYLGTVLLKLEKIMPSRNPDEYLTSIMDHIARHMAHFHDNISQNGYNLEMVLLLMGQRETRCFGSDEVTTSLVTQVRMLAREMGFPPEQERDLIYGCLLRDIGLMSKDDKFTISPQKLGFEDEYVYRRHPADGALMLAGLDLPPTIVEVVQGHHERFSGEGYPLGQKGREIPLAARVVSVVEHYVFMLTGVGGMKAMSPAEAAEKLHLDEDGRFDADLVQVFLKAVQRVDNIAEMNNGKVEEENNQDGQETVPVSPSESAT